ncbi:hypothetical protein [Larkinella arboricola]|uniref:Uncharacterized protein n=1 Tax=Larkinella arboricola TaxID=643671 RepID=A0A327WQ33_LARAB|nr:hypothetical protein [Larkinella arboricola]RAJ94046.1 hypothetical protein LX87_03930 [Larkinella arboricola]
MPSNALTQTAITATLNTLKSDTDAAVSVSSNDGVPVIDKWIKILQESRPATPVLDQLMQLRSLLQMPSPDPDQVKRLLKDLADNTTQIVQSSEGPWINELQQIALALQDFSDQL